MHDGCIFSSGIISSLIALAPAITDHCNRVEIIALWLEQTPFGYPVDPEV